MKEKFTIALIRASQHEYYLTAYNSHGHPCCSLMGDCDSCEITDWVNGERLKNLAEIESDPLNLHELHLKMHELHPHLRSAILQDS